MFNFMKKKPTAQTETPEQQAARDSAIDKVLLGYHVGDTSIATMVTGLERNGGELTLELRLPHESDLESIQQALGQLLQPHGIQTIHMNVRISAPMKGAEANLPKAMPKTTNAMDSQSKPVAKSDDSTVNAEPPITKPAPTQASLSAHPRIRHIIVVASGKGGVGKSTTTVNIALALQKLGNRVGVLDADIYGPSMPAMLGVGSVRPELENEQFVPINAHGLAMLSIGSLLDGDNTPVAWRGPKATGALMQLYNQTNWPQLDYLVIDMPPGTGDIQLTLAQRIPVTGAVIVTTPQHIALLDAQKGIEMFNKTNIPVLGVVENMALHTCSNCNHTEAIFGTGGGEKIAEQYQVPLLGQLPLASAIRAQVDKGEPSVLVDDEFASYYLSIAKNIETNINKFAKPVDDKRIF
ncbi:probable ATP-binding protein [Psychrobacter arcticus 273-4]|uniref:Iron-sulfur cluster carrier protein n=1 Tax=Psychrobacter arcticus (strain DSM 17307 / VKM B-2377 / 273-4) TaxID=259536 RepID=Q4FRT4_PSYA2|nr:iron-sulfur cluster carrier protein ApbC [Psychrobacter arcticus]AAZ19274.1 probable ATP-binding protein [Psychrobacter arcticus 273-4]